MKIQIGPFAIGSPVTLGVRGQGDGGSAEKRFPQFNCSLSGDGGQLIYKDYAHIGAAVDGPLGLLVPVLSNVDPKGVRTLATELSGLVHRARDKGLPLADMQGGCMSISSLGGIGGTSFSPIINLPEVAGLGVTANQVVAHWNGTVFEPRTMMPLSLSYDHCVINGANAARFCRFIAEQLADDSWFAN